MLWLPRFTTAIASESVENRRLDKAFELYWKRASPRGRQKAAQKILKTGASFDEIRMRLKKGRPYVVEVKKGRFLETRRNGDGTPHHYLVIVPEDYNPTRSYPLHVYLHGGVSRPAWKRNGRWDEYLKVATDPNRIAVLPASWAQSMWWQASQWENLAGILDALKTDYNVDENRVYLLGVSDGGTGAYFQAFRNTTAWAAFLPLIAHPAVLSNPSLGVDGEMFAPNLINKPLFIVNGGLDPLYPIDNFLPYYDLFREAGVSMVFRPLYDFGHDLRWWKQEEDNMTSFIADHIRDPLPDRLDWQTERTDRYHRAHWLVIEELGAVTGEHRFDPLNTVQPRPPRLVLGLELDRYENQKVRVHKVRPGTVADAAGLAAGDVLLKLNGSAIDSRGGFIEKLQAVDPEKPFDLLVERNGQPHTVPVAFPKPPGARSPVPAFRHQQPAGRVALIREGNRIAIQTQGIRRLRLLLSPDQIDFQKPLRVFVNGSLGFEGQLRPDREVLMKWAASDNDRTMLFGASLVIEPGENAAQ